MSIPQTPPSSLPAYKDSRFKRVYTPCERADSYRPGGFHPVHLGDVLHDRYRIIRKLGYGSFATVWLAVDSLLFSYVALKIHAANVDVSNESCIQEHLKANSPKDLDSRFVLLLSDSFVLEGPNGRHSCFVTQPMGPSLSDVLHGRPSPSEEFDPLNPPSRRFPTVHTKRFLRNMLLGLKFLHENQIVHGDLQPGNILFHLQDLAGLDPKDLEQNQTNSKLDPLIRIDGKVDLWAPKYLAVHEPLTRVALPQDQQIVKLADFGGAFWVDKPPASVKTPFAFRAPETILHERVSTAIDIWSFGCLMFELLTEHPLFELFTFCRQVDGVNDDHLIQISEIIGPLTPKMLAKWPRYSTYFGTDGKRLTAIPSGFDESEMGLKLERSCKNHGPPLPYDALKKKFYKYKPGDTDDLEAEEIVSLFKEILDVDPLRRPSAAQLLAHPWFRA